MSGTVKNANTCQLALLSHQSFPVVYSHNPTTACAGRHLLGAGHYRGQPEPGEAHGGLRPGRPQRAVLVHRVLLRVAGGQPDPRPTSPPPPTASRRPDRYPARASLGTTCPGPSAVEGLRADQTAAPGPGICASSASTTGPSAGSTVALRPRRHGQARTFPFTSSCSRRRAAGRSRSRRPGPRRPAQPPTVSARATTGATTTPEPTSPLSGHRAPSPRIWWLDVETAEGWPTSPAYQPVNAAIIQGASRPSSRRATSAGSIARGTNGAG